MIKHKTYSKIRTRKWIVLLHRYVTPKIRKLWIFTAHLFCAAVTYDQSLHLLDLHSWSLLQSSLHFVLVVQFLGHLPPVG